MTKLVFATNNKHKFEEIQKKVKGEFELLSLSDIGFKEEIPENQDTILGNALEKANYIYNRYKLNCFADDTGLEVDALNGEPGVYSARYAGPEGSAKKNIKKLLSNLDGIKNRKARFRTCIALVEQGKETIFNGEIEGEITTELKGIDGFGYDPVFKPSGYSTTFAEMPIDEKNLISHRALATNKLLEYLNAK